MQLPTIKAVNDVRIGKFKQQIRDALASGELDLYRGIIEEFEREENVPAVEIAAALARMFRGDEPLLLAKPDRSERAPERSDDRRPERSFEPRPPQGERAPKQRQERSPDPGMATFRVEVGYQHGVRPGNLVGAIANEASLASKQIGRIEILDDYSLIDLPEDLAPEMFEHLKTVWCANQQLRITRDGQAPDTSAKQPGKPAPPPRRRVFGKPFRPHRKGPRPE